MENDGKVHKKVFERVLHEARTFVSKEELAYIYRKCSDPLNEQYLDYNRLALDFNLYGVDLAASSSYQKFLNEKSISHLRKSSQDYVGGTFTNLKPMHKRAVTSLGGGNLLAKSHAQRFFTRMNP